MTINEEFLKQYDNKHVWHPASSIKKPTNFPMVKCAYGSYIELTNGRKLIDAISSWWCKSLGHAHPRLKNAIQQQMNHFEHVIFADMTNETMIMLSEKLSDLTNHKLSRVFYAADGSSAIEIAIKMSLHNRRLKNETKRNKFLALKNSYHGETIGALSISDSGKYRQPYQAQLFDAEFIAPLPYVLSTNDPLWKNCSEDWSALENTLNAVCDVTTAVVVEPILQGVGGMQLYSADFLKRLYAWAKRHDIHLIADEIMTGMGRTGKMFAYQYADIEPDFLCLAKGLTSGWIPFSTVLVHNDIAASFFDTPNLHFLHSHTFSGHALAGKVALEVLAVLAEEKLIDRANIIGEMMLKNMESIAHKTKKLTHVRSLGAMVAADLKDAKTSDRVCKKALELGALLRPLGKTIYWLPPLNIDFLLLDQLAEITERALLTVD